MNTYDLIKIITTYDLIAIVVINQMWIRILLSSWFIICHIGLINNYDGNTNL